jgi:murein DD-endopeptidase MepM/ murein hydrolase activator NlpD
MAKDDFIGTAVRGDQVTALESSGNFSSSTNQNNELLSSQESQQLQSTEGTAGMPASVSGTETSQGKPADIANQSKADAAQVIEQEAETKTLSDSKNLVYFREETYPVYYHDVIIYIQGVDVSPWLEGNLSVKYNINSDANTCDFTLNNAANRFILTPENLKGQWRTAKNSVISDDYDESAKKALYEFKSNPKHNRPDPESGGRVWPLSYWGSVFHKQDPIRVWISNPQARSKSNTADPIDEWLPVFTGYLTSFPNKTNHVNASSTISMHAEDIRSIMRLMRVNQNSYVYATEGVEASSPSTSEIVRGISTEDGYDAPNALRFPKGVNDQFDSNLFKDLIANTDKTITQFLWDSAPFTTIIETLTFSNEKPEVVIKRARQAINSFIESKRAAVAAEPDETRKAQLETELKVLEQQRSSYLINPGTDSETTTPPTGGTQPNSTGETVRSPSTDVQPGGSRLGRMQRGVFSGNKLYRTVYPTDRAEQVRFMQSWYSLCAFGTPIRDNQDYLDFGKGNRYWTKKQVKRAGQRTRYAGSWAPDAQAVHMMEPSVNATALPLFQDVKIRDSSNGIAMSRDFTNRLEIIERACGIVDYRYWVTGTGDLVFEFPNYDFMPGDYGEWGSVLTFDTHIIEENLNEEAGKIPTVLVGTKSATGNNLGQPTTDAQNALTGVNYEIVWAPQLVARLGIVVDKVPFNSITDSNRLAQLTTMAFQKKLGTFTQYTMSTLYRPWLQPNRPIFNKYRSRYALTETVAFDLPVTSGSVAGYNSPVTTMSLNYIRSIDSSGVPRYITGGPSMPIFYGERQASNPSHFLSILSPATAAFKEYLEDTHNLSPKGLKLKRDLYGSFIPRGTDTYNVLGDPLIGSLSEETTKVATFSEQLAKADNEAQKALSELQTTLDDRKHRSEKEINNAIRAAQDAIKAISNIFINANTPAIPEDSTAGVLPLFNITGIRHVTFASNPARLKALGSSSPDHNCDLDRYQFSSPLGTSKKDLRINFTLIQNTATFPRAIITDYNEQSSAFQKVGKFPGVDFIAIPGEDVYAAANGVVTAVGKYKDDVFARGSVIKINHDNGYETTYGALTPIVSKGDKVIRNQIIGKVSTSPRAEKMGVPVLHFQVSTGIGNTASVYSYALGNTGDVVNPGISDPNNTYYPITEEDVKWLMRAAIGETSIISEQPVVASAMLNRYVAINDQSIKAEGVPTWSSLTEFLIGKPPYGRGYSQPVSYYWRTAIPTEDGGYAVNGARTVEQLERRKNVRNIGTSQGVEFPKETEQLIRNLLSGGIPITPNIQHFRADDELVQKFLNDNKKSDMKAEHIPGVDNAFFSNDISRKLSARGLPKVTITVPSNLTSNFYSPTRDGVGSNPGVPHKKFIVGNDPFRPRSDVEINQPWTGNKVLLVGSLAGEDTDLGKYLSGRLQNLGATVNNFKHMGVPKDLTDGDTKVNLKDKLSTFQPDVTFIMYGASSVSNNNLHKHMGEIKSLVEAEGSDIWWVGPPVYKSSLKDLYKFKNIFDQEGQGVLESRYVKSDNFTAITGSRSVDGANVVGADADQWAKGILTRAYGKDKNPADDQTAIEQLPSDEWSDAIPPETCPPSRQAPTTYIAPSEILSQTAAEKNFLSQNTTTKTKFRAVSLDGLLPSFRDKVVQLIALMQDSGYDPIPYSVLRTPAEAAANAENNIGIENSMHIYGAAVDILSASSGGKNPEFFEKLGYYAESLGLTWGGRFNVERDERAHVQAIPIQYQKKLREIDTVEARDIFVSSFLA